MNKYQKWIADYKGDVYRKCKEVSEEMQRVFPELKIVKGLVTILEDSRDYQHQWLVDEEGNIVDPTATQWLGILEYKPIDENDVSKIPTGRCMNCGNWCFGNRRDTCSDECSDVISKYLNSY